MKSRLKNFFNNVNFKSIQVEFTVPFLIQFFSAILLISFLLYQGGKRAVRYSLTELQKEMLQKVEMQIKQSMVQAMQLNQVNADSWISGILDLSTDEKRNKYFVNHLKAYPQIAMSFVGLPDGSFYGARRTLDGKVQVVRNNADTSGDSWYYSVSELGDALEVSEIFKKFDARTRPWYKAAEDLQKPTFSSIYSHFVFKEPTVTAAYPVYENGKLKGIFGADLLLSWLGNTLKALPIGPSGKVFVTDDKGMLIANSENIYPFKKEDSKYELVIAEESGDILTKTVIKKYAGSENKDYVEFKLNNKKYYSKISRFEELGNKWNVYVVIADDDFLGDMNQALKQTIFIIILVMFLFIVFIFWTARSVTRPIIKLNKAARELAKGNLTIVKGINRKDEVGELIRSFNWMSEKLINLVTNLEKQVIERTEQLEKTNKELMRLSFSDGLTGVSNRRKFDQVLEEAWNSSGEPDSKLGLLMLDIDLFKNYNDTYGHQKGDECLKAIGKMLLDCTDNSGSFVARYGGEEFVVLIKNTDEENFRVQALKILKGVEELKIDHSKSPFKYVTISLGGILTYRKGNSKPEDKLKLADEALYRAKQKGRNRMELEFEN